MSSPRTMKTAVLVLGLVCLFSLQSGLVSGETPAFKVSTKYFSIAQTRLSPSAGLTTFLLANNSHAYIDRYFDFMIIYFDIHFSGGKLDTADSVLFSLLYITEINATHACGCIMNSNAMYDDAIYAHTHFAFDTELINRSRIASNWFADTLLGVNDLAFQINATGNFEVTFFVSVTIDYYQIDFEVSKDFIESIIDLDSPIDYVLYGLMLPLILLSTNVLLIQLLGVAFLLGYIAMMYWLARTVVAEVF